MAKEEQKEAPGAAPMVLHGVASSRNPNVQILKPYTVGPGGELHVRTRPDKKRQLLAQATLGATDTVVFTAQGGFVNCSISLLNSSGASRTFQLHHVPKGGVSADANLISAKGQKLASSGIPPKFVEMSLTDGQSIRGLCDSEDGVTVYIDGEPA